jgi:hypothetical protein
MKERPILYNTEMVKALLDGRKTQTRRLVKPQPEHRENESVPGCFGTFFHGWNLDHEAVSVKDVVKYCPYGQLGDRLIPAMEIPSLNRNYCADTYGRIWSRARDGRTWKILKGAPTSKGYLCVTPSVGGKYKTRLIHRLVAEAYYGYEPKGFKQVRHLDGDQLNNAPDNLDWGTQEDNWSDRAVHGTGMGESHHNSKLSHEIVKDIRGDYLCGNISQRSLSKKYEVSQSLIWAIVNNKVWSENTVANPPNMPRVASRINLEITDIRIERVQDITREDALAEGLKKWPHKNDYAYGFNGGAVNGHGSPTGAFQALWNSIYKNWADNPFVWVVEFRRV